jgi:hypothetical protein
VQTASLIVYLRPTLEVLAVASLCGWAACLALGLSLFSPARAIVVGLAGIVAGWSIWRVLVLPPGPALADVPLLPSLVGTLCAAFVAEIWHEAQDLRALKEAAAVRARARRAASAAAEPPTPSASPQGPSRGAPPP